MRSRRLAALAVVLPLVVLGGCGDNPKPKPYDPPTTSASPSPTTSTTPNADSPETVIRQFVTAQNQMMKNGKTDAFLALTSDCAYCVDFSGRVSKMYAEGGYIRTRGWTIVSIQSPVMQSDGDVSVRFVINSAPTDYKESRSGAVQRFDGGTGLKKRATLTRVAGQWRVDYLAEVS